MDTKNKKTIYFGLDAGNTSIKLKAGKNISDNYQNIYSYVDENQRKEIYELSGHTKLNKYNIKRNIDVNVCDGESTVSFIFEENAREKADNIKERENINKSDDKQLICNSMVSLANSLISKEMENENWEDSLEEEMEYNVYVVAGLPYKEYQKNGAKEKYKENLIKRFTIDFVNPSYPVKRVILNVLDARIDIEGYSAIKQTIAEKKLLALGPKVLKNKVVQLIDIGCYSIDVLGGEFNIDIDEEGNETMKFLRLSSLCFGLSKGIGTALDKVIELILNSDLEISQHTTITRNDITEAYKDNNGLISGTDISINPYYEKELNKIIDDFAKTLLDHNKKSGKENNLLKLYIAGGGSVNEVVLDRLKKKLKERYKDEMIEVTDNPIYANANGYYNTARVTFKK